MRPITDRRRDSDTRPPNLLGPHASRGTKSLGRKMTLAQKKSLVSVSSSAPRVSQKVIHSVDKKEGTRLRMGPSRTAPLRPQHTPTPQPTESIESASETRVQSPESGVQKILTSVTEVIDQLPTPNLTIASDIHDDDCFYYFQK